MHTTSSSSSHSNSDDIVILHHQCYKAFQKKCQIPNRPITYQQSILNRSSGPFTNATSETTVNLKISQFFLLCVGLYLQKFVISNMLEQGFSINFLQGPNCFDQKTEGPNAQNRPAPTQWALKMKLTCLCLPDCEGKGPGCRCRILKKTELFGFARTKNGVILF